GRPLETRWAHLTRVPLYAPIFDPGYRNPPAKSATFSNLYFAGNYRTHPSIASTGTALGGGIETAEAMLEEHGGETDLGARVHAFRLRGMPIER
ncbi:MAG: hypothetical protein ACREQJ_03500, partial [Candidatus Binatia bacterium]